MFSVKRANIIFAAIKIIKPYMNLLALLFVHKIAYDAWEFITGQDCPDGVPVTYVKYSNSAPSSLVQPILLYASTPGVAITAECYNR